MVASKLFRPAARVSALLAMLLHIASPVSADLLKGFPQKAGEREIKFQPYMDFDTDCCYNVAAVDPEGKINPGLGPWKDEIDVCHTRERLNSGNVYSRQRCNHGWCMYMYGYYFEMDPIWIDLWVTTVKEGHRHDWEHVIVWTKDDKPEYVAVSQHGDYELRAPDEFEWDGTHAKVVYHKNTLNTRAIRFANERDDGIENHSGEWFHGDLLSWYGFPEDKKAWDKMTAENWGSAHMDLLDGAFIKACEDTWLHHQIGDGFDCAHDGGSEDPAEVTDA